MALGIVLGDLVFIGLTLLGLTTLAITLGSFFILFRYLGGAYLIWLGIRLLTAKIPGKLSLDLSPSQGLSASFIAGFLVTLGDVKALFFYASLFPTFVDLALLTPLDIAIILGVTILTVLGVKLTYAYSAQKLVRFSRQLKVGKSLKCMASGLVIGTGVYLMLKD